MGSAPLWTSADLWPQSSSSYILTLLPIIVLRPRIPPCPCPSSSPSSLSPSFILATVLLHILLDVLLSVLFVTSLLVWWLWGSICGHGVHSFPRGLVVQYRVVVVVALWEFVVAPVVLSWLWLGCCCRGWIVLVVVAPSSSRLCCRGGVVALFMHMLGLAARHSTCLVLPRHCVIHG